ncbi:helix-turn-helix transcriptional regulator [Kitasatospora sp. NPDC088346]|uniref:helix-turn-helix domain-containing protein n=1 Tax=Kitasatospora sp. NPDC088346 TaxID=3364073 RepID=UPI003816DAF9
MPTDPARPRPATPHPRIRRTHDADLSPREHQVVGLLTTGATNQDIARALSLSVRTVEHHVARTLKKLHTTRRDIHHPTPTCTPPQSATSALRRGLATAHQRHSRIDHLCGESPAEASQRPPVGRLREESPPTTGPSLSRRRRGGPSAWFPSADERRPHPCRRPPGAIAPGLPGRPAGDTGVEARGCTPKVRPETPTQVSPPSGRTLRASRTSLPTGRSVVRSAVLARSPVGAAHQLLQSKPVASIATTRRVCRPARVCSSWCTSGARRPGSASGSRFWRPGGSWLAPSPDRHRVLDAGPVPVAGIKVGGRTVPGTPRLAPEPAGVSLPVKSGCTDRQGGGFLRP